MTAGNVVVVLCVMQTLFLAWLGLVAWRAARNHLHEHGYQRRAMGLLRRLVMEPCPDAFPWCCKLAEVRRLLAEIQQRFASWPPVRPYLADVLRDLADEIEATQRD